ncbi:ABA4-like family protein [Candidatus Pelagibacter sp. HIMB1321]|uniref:ABA4-like family protein n=1 Tax=Candidatus Pelagibacter sp. HIMB1321 TaxID=1388755 RepID=UPI000A080AE0|nr:ABA4-like family protein [Candidatus Pelagibacter sp. HIMB1321]SMF77142.1 protein of unknown function [Candidatus Pelagibacter sp. HIMB1321]
MIEQIYTFFNSEMLYLWINIGVLPFWLLLIFFPQSHLCKYFVTSIFPILILSGVYVFILYKAYIGAFDFDNNFSLYLGINYLTELFKDEYYLLMFWTHFVSINLFVGGWILNDSKKYYVNKILLSLPLILTYLIGPVGIFLYWIIKIFYSKKFNLY